MDTVDIGELTATRPVSLEEMGVASEARARNVEYPLKRPIDFVLASVGLLISLPIWALVALAIKLEDGGPIFYVHDRIGQGAKRFTAFKFRSLVDREHPSLKGHPPESAITRVGGIMRKMALDELPQLINILRGDMSFVGPRALPAKEFEEKGALTGDPGFRTRHHVRPGLTGVAQVYADRDVPYRVKFRYDRFYVENQSLGLDLWLIARSVWISLRGKWPEIGGRP